MEESPPLEVLDEDPEVSKAPSRGSVWFRGGVALIAGLVGAALVGRGSPAFVAWELVRTHRSVTSQSSLGLSLWTSDPHAARRWLDARGTEAPLLPARTAGLDLVGVRYSVLLDRVAVHAIYGNQGRTLSIFYIKGPARIGARHHGHISGHATGLVAVGDTVVGIVADTPEEVTAFESAFARVWV